MAKQKDKKRSKLKNRLINFGLILMLLVGLGLIFNNQIKYFLMSLQPYDSRNFTAEDLARNNQKDTPFDFDGISPVSIQAVINARFNDAGLPIIGQIVIPDLDMRLPIFRGLSDTALLYGAGTMKPDQVMGKGNYALASHHIIGDESLLFSPLTRAKEGQMIFMTDLKNIYQYKISKIQIVYPDAVWVIDDVPGEKLITLVTCNDPAMTQRIIVTGELVKSKSVENATPEMIEALKTHVTQADWG